MIPVGLYYKKILIAVLSNTTNEFPRSNSIYKIVDNMDPFILDYINSSIKYSKLVETGTEQELEFFVQNEESKYIELIESEYWSIVDSEGLFHSILAPLFQEDNILVWMLKL